MHQRFIRSLAAVLGAACFVPVAASAQDGPPPPPTAANGGAVTTLAQGLGTPTSFAFGGGVVFAGTAPSEEPNGPIGGVYALAGGKATPVEGIPPIVFGLAWRKGTLYASSGRKLYAASGWNGTKFAKVKAIYVGPKLFTGFSGLAFGPNGRLYAGVALGAKFDHKQATSPFGNAVVSMRPNGTDIEVVADGFRQPWQLTFVKGNRNPYVTVLAQDNLKNPPPDWIVVAKPEQSYGFPTCTWAKPKPCRGLPKPLVLLPDHSSPMGIGAIGQKLYVALFGGLGKGPVVASMTSRGKQIKPFLSGFAAPVVALGTHKGTVYTGDLTGSIYNVKP